MAIVVDTSQTTINTNTFVSLAVTTNFTNETIIAIVWTHDSTVTGISSAGVPGGFVLKANVLDVLQIYEGLAPEVLAGVLVTATLAGSAGVSLTVLGVKGNIAEVLPFDTNPLLPVTAGPDSVIGQHVEFSTDEDECLLIYACGNKGPVSSIANPTGWTSRGYSGFVLADLRVSSLNISTAVSELDVNPTVVDAHETTSIGIAILSGAEWVDTVVSDEDNNSILVGIETTGGRDHILVEVDTHSGVSTETVRLCVGSDVMVGILDDNERVGYDPRLYLPIEFGISIQGEQYGNVARGVLDSGDIQFAIDEDIWQELSYHWKGREFRIYLGKSNSWRSDFEIIFTGRVENLVHDVLTGTVQTSDVSLDLDKSLINDLYDETFSESIRNRPKPKLYGQGINLQPILIDEANQIYQISFTPLSEVTSVRVGGITWDKVLTFPPGSGEWYTHLDLGTIHLGSVTLGGEVRCDAKAFDWETLTSAELISLIVTDAGGVVDSAALTQLDIDAPYLIGYHTGLELINRLDVLDEIMLGLGGYWAPNSNGEITAGVFSEPDEISSQTFDESNVLSINQVELIAPAFRIRVEYQRNWSPQNQFFEAVSEEDKQKWAASGVVSEKFEDLTILNIEPRAIDVPVIRSLVLTEADANDIRDRLKLAWSQSRKLYDIETKSDLPDLYSTVDIDYLMVNGSGRVLSVLRSLGEGTNKIRIWTSAIPDLREEFIEENPSVLTEDGGSIILFADDSEVPLMEDS